MIEQTGNPDPNTGNPDTNETPDATQNSPGDAGIVTETSSSWKNGLSSDLQNSPVVQKFDDTPDGLAKMAEGYNNLEKLLGHEKVPIPKGVEDVEGWNRFSKAMGIPDKAEGYGLGDVEMPESLQEASLDKNRFAEIVHAHKLTPAQAQGLWKAYSETQIEAYNQAMEVRQKQLDETINVLKSKWGDAYDTNVELGQTVINKFSSDQDMNDYLTALLTQDPKGISFLAKIGEQFAENKVGEFQMKRFSLAPEQAQEEIQKISKDMNHPYNNPNATDREHTEAVDYVNSLYAIVNKAKGQA